MIVAEKYFQKKKTMVGEVKGLMIRILLVENVKKVDIVKNLEKVDLVKKVKEENDFFKEKF